MLSHRTRRRCLAYAGCWLALEAWSDCSTMLAPNWSMASILPLLLQNTNHKCMSKGSSCHLWPQGMRLDLSFMLPGTVVSTDNQYAHLRRGSRVWVYSWNERHPTMSRTWSYTCRIAHLFFFSPQGHPWFSLLQGCVAFCTQVSLLDLLPREFSAFSTYKPSRAGTEFPAGCPVPVPQPLWLPVMVNLPSPWLDLDHHGNTLLSSLRYSQRSDEEGKATLNVDSTVPVCWGPRERSR